MALTLPLYFLLIPYGIFLAFFAFYAFFNALQLYKHGADCLNTRLLVSGFVIAIALILGATAYYGADIDWNESFTLGTSSLAPL